MKLEIQKSKQILKVIVETLKKLGAIVENVTMPTQLMRTLLPTYTIIANSEATSNHSCLDGIKYGNTSTRKNHR